MKKYGLVSLFLLFVLVGAGCEKKQTTFDPPENARVVTVAARGAHAVALKSDGSVWTWGDNRQGQLGLSEIEKTSRPTRVEGIEKITSIAAGNSLTFVVKNDGSVWGWGNGTEGALGISLDREDKRQMVPIQITGLKNIKEITSGRGHALARQGDKLFVWGMNVTGKLGTGESSYEPFPKKIDIKNVQTITVSDDTSYALKTDGTVWATGYNGYGEVGIENHEDTNSFVPVPNTQNVKDMAAGTNHVLTLNTEGQIIGWGKNELGELGTGTTERSLLPTVLTEPTNVIAVAAGDGHSLALTAAGQVWSWGYNQYGQLGDGSTEHRASPSPIPDLGNIIAIAAGHTSSYALDRDGRVWSWGDNTFGQLGTGDEQNRTKPTETVSGE